VNFLEKKSAVKLQDRARGLGRKRRGDRKAEPNDSPEIPDRKMRDTRHPQPPFGAQNNKGQK